MFTEIGKRIFNQILEDNGRANFGNLTELGHHSFPIYFLILLSETGLASDNILWPQISLLVADSGLASDDIINRVSMLLSDNGLGTELIDLLMALKVIDNTSSSDLVNILNSLILSDSITADDSNILVEVKTSLQDSGTGTELENIIRTIRAIDSGMGLDEAIKTVLGHCLPYDRKTKPYTRSDSPYNKITKCE